MSVRTKILLIIIPTTLAAIAVLYASSRLIILRSFGSLEREETVHELSQGVDALDDVISTLGTQVKDWGGWDETYAFAMGRNPKYVKVNINPDNLTNLRLNLLMYLKPSGGIIYSRGFDYKDRKPIPVPEEFSGHLEPIRRLLSRADMKDSINGVVLLPAGPMMVAAHQILKGDYTGPSRGIIIMGRLLSADEVDNIAGSTHLGIKIHRYDDPRLPEDFKKARPRLADGDAVFTQPLGPGSTAGYAPVRDIYGRPALIFRVENKRGIFRQGEKTVNYFLFSLLAISSLLGVAVVLILERTVLSRLARLSAGVERVGTGGELSSRVSLSGNDELAGLATAVNRMLSELEVSQEEVRRKEALRRSEERYRGLVEHSPDAVLIYNEGKNVFSNAAGVRLLGAKDMDEVIGRPVEDMVVPSRKERFRKYIQQVEEGKEPLKLEEKIVRLDGSLVNVEVAAVPFTYQDRSAAQVIVHDITERKRYEEKISYMAYYDSLTGLPNRLLLYDRLNLAIKSARRKNANVSVLFLDLDNFKRINDTLGHTTGDRLLKGVAERLTGILRPGDSVAHLGKDFSDRCLSHLGGDEFVILLTDIADNIKDTAKVAQRVVDAMNQAFKLDDQELFITTSIGITLFPYNGEDPDTLLRNADVAMYKAKDQGRNNYQFYSQSMNDTAYERLVMENNLRTALKREEFLLHYQPQVDIRDGRLVGFEALVRWRHGERGMVPPGDFIPIAEENGLIVPIGEWVLRTACSQYKAWRKPGAKPFRMAVNLSSYQFRQKTLLETVAKAVSDYGIGPGSLELELTESIIMKDAEEAVKTMGELKKMGISITVDDFGTGYSSLSYLKRFPLDSLKIDASFVRDITKDPDDAAITKTIIAMAHNLNLTVVAEGVETEEQLAFLLENGCDVAQGYLFSRPMPAEDLAGLLEGEDLKMRPAA